MMILLVTTIFPTVAFAGKMPGMKQLCVFNFISLSGVSSYRAIRFNPFNEIISSRCIIEILKSQPFTNKIRIRRVFTIRDTERVRELLDQRKLFQ